jgi:hypothetical protein
MAKKTITFTTRSGNGTSINFNNVSYVDKVDRYRDYGIKFTFHSGASKTLWYGWSGEVERNQDFREAANQL